MGMGPILNTWMGRKRVVILVDGHMIKNMDME